MSNLNKGGVAIIDFGSQYTQLIARRVREQFVFSELNFEPEKLPRARSSERKFQKIMKNVF